MDGDAASKISHIVYVDQYDNFCSESSIIALDCLLQLTKQYPDDENPFQHVDEDVIAKIVNEY